MRSKTREGHASKIDRLSQWHKVYAMTPTRVFCGPQYDSWCWVWREYYWRKFGTTSMFLTNYLRYTEEWHSHRERERLEKRN